MTPCNPAEGARPRPMNGAGGTKSTWPSVLFAAILALLSVEPAFAQKNTYLFARGPQLSAATSVETWSPLLEEVSRRTGVTLKLKVYVTRQKFEAELFGGTPDFFFDNPYHAVLAYEKHGYIPLIRDGARQLTGILVVKRDSPVQSLAQLNGSSLVFPFQNAFAASVYLRAILTEREHLEFEPKYLGTHENVYRTVFLGKAVAGGGVRSTFDEEPEQLREQLRILFETPSAAPHPLSAHPRVPAQIRNAVAQAFLDMSLSPQGQALLRNAGIVQPVRADFQRDYLPLKYLGLERYLSADTQ